jgi:hypothetical protein
MVRWTFVQDMTSSHLSAWRGETDSGLLLGCRALEKTDYDKKCEAEGNPSRTYYVWLRWGDFHCISETIYRDSEFDAKVEIESRAYSLESWARKVKDLL